MGVVVGGVLLIRGGSRKGVVERVDWRSASRRESGCGCSGRSLVVGNIFRDVLVLYSRPVVIIFFQLVRVVDGVSTELKMATATTTTSPAESLSGRDRTSLMARHRSSAKMRYR